MARPPVDHAVETRTLDAPELAGDPVGDPAPDPPIGPTDRFGRLGRVLHAAMRRPGLVVACLVVLVMMLWAAFPELFATHDPYLAVPSDRLQGPGPQHWFGTDDVGRDLYSRVVEGARGSLSAAVLAVAIGLVIGSLAGLLAGFFRGWIDDVVMRIVDTMLAIPALLLALAVVSALGFGTIPAAIAVGAVSIAAFTRLMRSEVLRVRGTDYVEAARSSGVGPVAVLWRHVLPNSWGSVLVLATLEFGTALLAISTLSFLGFGTPPPSPEWGALVASGRTFLVSAWWMTVLPGAAIAVVVLSVNRVSRALEREETDE